MAQNLGWEQNKKGGVVGSFVNMFCSRPNFYVARIDAEFLYKTSCYSYITNACYASYVTLKHQVPCFKLIANEAQQHLPTAQKLGKEYILFQLLYFK